MARRMTRARSRSRLPPATVAWLPAVVDETAERVKLGGDLNSTLTEQNILLYDFSKDGAIVNVARTYGGGDWTVERHIGDLFLMTDATGDDANKQIRVCFGLGMLNAGHSALQRNALISNIADPRSEPEVSWMFMICCDIRLGQFEVTKCDLNFGRSRRIDADARIILTVTLDPLFDLPEGGSAIRWGYNGRWLVRQRGSRL